VLADLDWAPDGRYALRFVVSGEHANLRLPQRAAPSRREELWRHTCGELFVRSAAAAAYCELNFSPSGAWAAYTFDGYRAGMRPAPLHHAPAIDVQTSDGAWRLLVSGNLPAVTHDWAKDALQFACTMVIETADGALSYWALRHPPGVPDFHHGDGFRWQAGTATG
jgi:hypothetical protein